MTSTRKDALAAAVREDLTRSPRSATPTPKCVSRLLDDIAERQSLRDSAVLGAAARGRLRQAYQIPEDDRQRFANEFRPWPRARCAVS